MRLLSCDGEYDVLLTFGPIDLNGGIPVTG